ncbi:MAG: Gfo/Idh/MocA family protein [Candidatus Binatia bacterium]
MTQLGVAVIGCGLIGARRAAEAVRDPRSRCVAVTDLNAQAAGHLAADVGAEVVADWRAAVSRPDVGAVVVATPNGFLAEISCAALGAGKHVVVEKPMGRSLSEALGMQEAARRAGRVLKVGFNHRYHPAIAEAKRRFDHGDVGTVINARCRYGHGGRAGYEREWRGSKELAGGGELTDQGVHVADLLHWFLGQPSSAFAWLQTAVWPIGDLEDNAFGMFRYPSGAVAMLHTSWTQWKNLFSLEIFGARGALLVEGLGRSYGPETLTVHCRKAEGGVPDTETKVFEGEDSSWRMEWADFLGAVLEGKPMLGTAGDGVVAMRMLDALYRSAGSGAPATL